MIVWLWSVVESEWWLVLWLISHKFVTFFYSNVNKHRFWMRKIAIEYYPHTRKLFGGLRIQEPQQILTLTKCITSFLELKWNSNNRVQWMLKLGLRRAARWGGIPRCEFNAFMFFSQDWHICSLSRFCEWISRSPHRNVIVLGYLYDIFVTCGLYLGSVLYVI